MDYPAMKKKLVMPIFISIGCILFISLVWCLLHRGSTTPDAETASSKNDKEQPVTIKVPLNDTGIVYDDTNKNADLLISLTQISLESSPSKISATIRSPFHQEFEIKDKAVGSSFSYNGKSNYDIQILKVDAIKAEFFVTRKSD